MTDPTTVTVLGATGNTGRRAARDLAAAGVRVRAVGRSADRLAAEVPDAEPWVGDQGDVDFLTAALTGADAAYVLLPFDPSTPGYQREQDRLGGAVVAALGAAGVRYVVALSSLGAELPTGTGFLTSLHRQERRLATLSADVLLLRPGLYLESFLATVDAMRSGVHADSLDADVLVPMVATTDVGAAAAVALLERARTGVLELPGPAELTVTEVVAALGPAIGVPALRYLRVPDQEMVGALVEAGLPADVASLQVEVNAALNARTVRPRGGARGATPTTLADLLAEKFGARTT